MPDEFVLKWKPDGDYLRRKGTDKGRTENKPAKKDVPEWKPGQKKAKRFTLQEAWDFRDTWPPNLRQYISIVFLIKNNSPTAIPDTIGGIIMALEASDQPTIRREDETISNPG